MKTTITKTYDVFVYADERTLVEEHPNTKGAIFIGDIIDPRLKELGIFTPEEFSSIYTPPYFHIIIFPVPNPAITPGHS